MALALLVACVLASPAAATPLHLSDGSITGLDHACGAATDSEGDLYLSSAGDSEIRIYDSERNLLGTLSNSNEPCGLAVGSNGTLYVSESGTGEVVRYMPSAYPFAGAPAYGAREVIDSSGEAKGISVDPFDDRLYVAEGNRVGVYRPDGGFDLIDEVQQVIVDASSGTYTLSFNGSEPTEAIAYNAGASVVQAALEGLSTIGPGNVSVVDVGGGFAAFYDITFTGSLANTQLPQVTGDETLLTGGFGLSIKTTADGFDGTVGEGELTEATGIAAYTYPSVISASDPKQNRYVFVADAATDEIKTFGSENVETLELRNTNDGSATPSGSFEFGAQGAYLAVDQGTCPPEAQACTAGHVFAFDTGHEVLDEFEAGGHFLDQVEDPGFEDAEPTAVAVDRSAGESKGTLWVSTGAGAGAKALAFKPLPAPSRSVPSEAPGEEHSLELENACGAAVDGSGNRYAAGDNFIHVYGPSGTSELAKIEDPKGVCQIAVDAEGRVYAVDDRFPEKGHGRVVYFTPSSYPPEPGTTYSGPTVIAQPGDPLFPAAGWITGLALNPANGHVFVAAFLGMGSEYHTIEFDSAAEGSGVVDENVGGDLGGPDFGIGAPIAVDGPGNRFFFSDRSGDSSVFVLDLGSEEDPDDEKLIGQIKNADTPSAGLDGISAFAVDQASGHLLIFDEGDGWVEEYEATGALVARTGQFKKALSRPAAIAVDNSGGANDGFLYVAHFGNEAGRAYEGLIGFEALGYGEPPQVKTRLASEVGGGSATLNGTVNPRKFAVGSCTFEYILQADYDENEKDEKPLFEGATPVACEESPESLGKGAKALPVHAAVESLDPAERYRYRLVATNEFGSGLGLAGRFGPPAIEDAEPNPVSYTEATARALIDPAGLTTAYHLEYGPTPGYGQSTGEVTLDPEAGPTQVVIHLFGLAEATTYHLRLIASNEAGEAAPAGEDQQITTLQRRPAEACSNQEYRVGRSANLPDCRAYELVTPGDTRGTSPYAFPARIDSWFTDPRGATAGESLTYNTNGTLPGFEGNGRMDGYRAARGAGAHPKAGWSNALTGPSYDQEGGGPPAQPGVSPDQRYSLWEVEPQEVTAGALDPGQYLSTPAGFEPIGRGALGTDLDAIGHFLGRGGAHVIFSSKAQLEEAAAPAGTSALYERQAGSDEAEVVSVKPDGTPFGAGEGATFLGANESGEAIAFKVGGALYLRHGGKTTQVATAANTFAGISADGDRVFYVAADVSGGTPAAAALRLCDTSAGPCPGAGEVKITAEGKAARFVNVSEDGSRVYLTSTEELGGEGTSGEDNLYLWEADTGETRFVGLLDSQDLVAMGFEGLPINLIRWPNALGKEGRGVSPTRSTPDGSVLVFESHASLTAYDTQGSAQIYRYDAGAEAGEAIACVSCGSSGAPPGADATLAAFYTPPLTSAYTALIPNLAEDGQTVLFESPERLLPEDANTVVDVYEWRAQGSAWCERPGGCLALISSGQADTDSHLYAMSADGHDVFFSTEERLAGADVPGSSSIYDARVGGGIPDPPAPAPCEGDACQGSGNPPPPTPPPASSSVAPSRPAGQSKSKARKCPKGKRKVKVKVRCVKSKARKKHHRKHHRANRRGRGSR